MLTEFVGRTAVITGAGSGFGREFARLAASRGMNLVLADIQQDALDETARLLESGGAQIRVQVTDVSKYEQMESLRDLCLNTFGPPHLLFNNAGVATGGLLWEHGIKDWAWVMGVNLWGVIHGVRAFVPTMVEQGQPGHVINTASVAGLLSAPNMGIYNVSKHGVVALSETLFHDLRLIDSPLSVSVLCPAFVPTGISQSHRNRPQDLAAEGPDTQSMQQAREATDRAVSSGRISAAEVASVTFEAIEQDRFYIITHDNIMPSVKLRLDDVAMQRNPTDPFSLKRGVAPKAS